MSAHPLGMCQSDYIITFLFCMMFFLPPLSFKGRAWLTTFKLEEEGDRKMNLLFKFLLLTITFWETLITQSHWKNVKNQSSQERWHEGQQGEKSLFGSHFFFSTFMAESTRSNALSLLLLHVTNLPSLLCLFCKWQGATFCQIPSSPFVHTKSQIWEWLLSDILSNV